MSRNSFLIARGLTAEPVSRKFGFDRGTPIDRYYVEKFLQECSHLIRGTVLEVGDPGYTNKFGDGRVTRSIVINDVSKIKGKKLPLDLITGKGIPRNVADCFILTQTLPFIFPVAAVAEHAVRALKPGGTLLVTVPGITSISRHDMERWGQYWSFTDLSLKKIFANLVPAENLGIKAYGNVKTAAAFLYGIPREMLSLKELDYYDPDYQLLISAVVAKPDV